MPISWDGTKKSYLLQRATCKCASSIIINYHFEQKATYVRLRKKIATNSNMTINFQNLQT